jgi:hypothetical protein
MSTKPDHTQIAEEYQRAVAPASFEKGLTDDYLVISDTVLCPFRCAEGECLGHRIARGLNCA